jgi:hypothetical protein
MRLDEFDRLNLHDDVRYRGQLHSVVHISRRTGTTYLRPTPGYGGIVGPISFADISGSVIQDPRSDSWGGMLMSRQPVVGAPVDDDSTIEFLPAS